MKTNVIDKYGGLEHLKAPPKELLLAQTENYVEYSRTGQVIKGQERATVSKHDHFDLFILLITVGKIEIRRRCSSRKSQFCLGFILGRWPMGLCMLSVNY